MTCKDCGKFKSCSLVRRNNGMVAHKMWLYNFWMDADTCISFVPNSEEGRSKETCMKM